MLEIFDIAKAAVILIGALIYFFMPLDAFPDMVPYVGRLDDLAILLAAIPSAVKLYAKYKSYRDKQEPTKS